VVRTSLSAYDDVIVRRVGEHMSQSLIARRLGVHVNRVYHAVERLKREGRITTEAKAENGSNQ
jgi:DNA-binding CsgD family transcriptional regulator